VRVNLDTILTNKAHNGHGMIQNDIFKNINSSMFLTLLAHQQEVY